MIRPAVVAMLLLIATSARGDDGETEWYPTLHLQPRIEFGPYYARACGCFDRYDWSAGFGGALELHRFLQLESEYRLGGLWFPGSGYAETRGWSIGGRAGILGLRNAWTDGIYARAGVLRLEVPTTREVWHTGGYGGAGYSLPLFGERMYFESEVVLSFVGGDLAHTVMALRGGVRIPLRW